MVQQALTLFRHVYQLSRSIAVVSSSIAAILSSLLPLRLYTSISTSMLIFFFFFLCLAAFTIHGVLTHAFNDYTDSLSGTDQHSPGILSGGSRLIQTKNLSPFMMWRIATLTTIALLFLAIILFIAAQYKLAALLLIGIWAAVSYSLAPLRLSYRPFLGDWLSLFPAMFFLGIAGPWLLLDPLPEWAVQNATINALVCMGWVMVHHIPDIEADQQAAPVKRTSVVWFVDQFGLTFARAPAFLYFLLTGLCTFWLGSSRLEAAISLSVLSVLAIYIVIKIDATDYQQTSLCEKTLMLIAILIAVCLGVFV